MTDLFRDHPEVFILAATVCTLAIFFMQLYVLSDVKKTRDAVTQRLDLFSKFIESFAPEKPQTELRRMHRVIGPVALDPQMPNLLQPAPAAPNPAVPSGSTLETLIVPTAVRWAHEQVAAGRAHVGDSREQARVWVERNYPELLKRRHAEVMAAIDARLAADARQAEKA